MFTIKGQFKIERFVCYKISEIGESFTIKTLAFSSVIAKLVTAHLRRKAKRILINEPMSENIIYEQHHSHWVSYKFVHIVVYAISNVSQQLSSRNESIDVSFILFIYQIIESCRCRRVARVLNQTLGSRQTWHAKTWSVVSFKKHLESLDRLEPKLNSGLCMLFKWDSFYK